MIDDYQVTNFCSGNLSVYKDDIHISGMVHCMIVNVSVPKTQNWEQRTYQIPRENLISIENADL